MAGLSCGDVSDLSTDYHRSWAGARACGGNDPRPACTAFGDRDRSGGANAAFARPRRSRQHRPVPCRRRLPGRSDQACGQGQAQRSTPDLDELKRLLVEEQGEIRGVRDRRSARDRELELAEAVEELRALAVRLGQQWSIDCQVSANGERRVDPDPASARSPAIAPRSGRQCRPPRRRRPHRRRRSRSTTDQLAAQCRRQWFGFSDRQWRARRSNPGRSRSGSSAPTARCRLVSKPGSTNILIITASCRSSPRDPSPACR